MEDFKVLAELTPLFQKFPVAFFATISIGYLFTGVGKWIKFHFDKSVQQNENTTDFLHKKIDSKLDKIIDSTIHIENIRENVGKIHYKISKINSKK